MSNHNVIPEASRMPASDVWRLATRQGGVASRRQLLRLGMSAQEIKTAVRAGRLVPIYRGVYAVGHLALTDHGRARAAILAAGPQAVSSHHTAAALLTLTPSLPAVLDVTLIRGDRRSRPGLRVHHTTRPPEKRRVAGILVTSPLRTLEDLGFPDDLTREALAKRLIAPSDVPLVVETDGWATHGYRAAFERDRARDARLAAAGITVLRFTHRQLAREPVRAIVRIAQAAAARAPSASKSSVYGWPVASATGS